MWFLKIKIIPVFLLFFISACSGWEFVYQNNKIEKLNKRTSFDLNQDVPYAASYLREILNTQTKDPEFELLLDIAKNNTNLVTKTNPTANTIEVEYSINYLLKNLKKNCNILSKTIITKSYYNSKSSGYSFGTDLAKKEVENSVLKKNIDTFIGYIDSEQNILKCKTNENQS